MISAVFFDFYSVWHPDTFGLLLAEAGQGDPEIAKQLSDVMESYYHGQAELSQVVEAFRTKLNNPQLNVEQFKLYEFSISPEVVSFMRNLHLHFIKLGILANLGHQEYEILSNWSEHNQVFEVIASPLSLQLKEPLLSREVFDAALKAIGEPTRSTLLVSGNVPFLQFAASLGISTIQFEGFDKLKRTIGQYVNTEEIS